MMDSLHAHRVYTALLRMSANGRVRTSSALPKLASQLELSRIDVNEAIRCLNQASLLEYTADPRGLPVSGFISVVKEDVRTPRHELDWAQAMILAGIDKEAATVLLGLSAKLEDVSPSDMNLMANALKKLANSSQDELNDAGFNISAQCILSGSKVLSQLSPKMLHALGLPARLHTSSPRYVVCAGPAEPVATLLIENPRAFENAIRSGLANTVALVCTYGFGLSYLGQEWLHAELTSDLDRPIIMVRSGSPPSLDKLFSLPRVYLWADLDRAAFSIYLSLTRSIPHLLLSAIYRAMDVMLDDPSKSHPYSKIFDKAGQIISEEHPHKDVRVIELWRRCALRAVDQEAVLDADILRFGAAAL